MSLGRAIILKTASWGWVTKMVRNSFVFRPLVRRFIAGDTLAEALLACEPLCESGLKITLDYLGENTHSEAEALQAKKMYIEILDGISSSKYAKEMNISIKLTQCGLDQGEAFAEQNYRDVLEIAKSKDIFVRVDMEGSDYTQRTIDMIQKVFPHFSNTGTVLQSYLYRSFEDVKTMNSLGARVRVVKGAYLEPASVAYPEKSKVDDAYIEMAKLLLLEGNYPAIATHDTRIIDELKAFVKQNQIDPSKFEWQMLYGIRRDLQQQLVKEGFNVRVYVPYGDSWYPYFTRRLAERPANGFFKG
jgi:proline dehydrogenase